MDKTLYRSFENRRFISRVLNCTCDNCPILWYCGLQTTTMGCRGIAERFIKKVKPGPEELRDLVDRSYYGE